MSLSVTCTVRLNIPKALVVPEIVPLLAQVSPSGRPSTVQVYGGWPPEAVNVVE